MKQFSKIFLFTLIFNFHFILSAQSISGIINNYTRIVGIDTCAAQMIVSDASKFKKNDKILLIQMNGATIQTNNSDVFGNIQSLNQAGKYEINEIDSISVNTIFLRFKFLNDYAVTNSTVQMVSFPVFNIATITDTLRAKPWDGSTGGIIAFEATSVVLNAPIKASAVGFRGGAVRSYSDCNSFLANYGDFYYDLNTNSVDNGGPKGEGVANTLSGKECGKGPQATGGGGGNNHKSGGGGGAHLSGGGNGGEQIRDNNFTKCPGNNPGLAGKPLSNIGSDRFFFGGGGGAGQNREGSNSKGGIGGGIVLIKANTITGNGLAIQANGEAGGTALGDGAGGGGAGGAVILQVNQYVGNLTVETKGGIGGNSSNGPGYQFGPGGGGSGGRILLKNTAPLVTNILTGGTAGKNINTTNTQGAGAGSAGFVATNANLAILTADIKVNRLLSIVTQPAAQLACENNATSLSVNAIGLNLSYQWQENMGSGFTPLSNDVLYDSVATSKLIIKKVSPNMNPFQYRCVITGGCGASASSINTSSISLNIRTLPMAIFSYNISNNTVLFNNGSSGSNIPTTYQWTFGNGKSDSAVNPVHIYAVQDTYRVNLKATNACGSSEYSSLINLNTPPLARFTFSTTNDCAPATIRFFNKSSDNVRSFSWSFPGGIPSISTDSTPSVKYLNAGNYKAILTVRNGFGDTTASQTVNINSKPTINFTATSNGLVVVLNNTTQNASSFKWLFGDGTTDSVANPVHVYKASGTYVIKLIAKNVCDTSELTQQITILGLAAASISANQSLGCAPLIVQFSGNNISNVATWNWTFTGGSPATSTLPSPRIIYSNPGKYGVALTITSTNSTDLKTVKQDSVITVLTSPKSSFTFKARKDTVEFTNNSSDADSFTWNFGDNTTSNLRNPPPHIYPRNGNYSATLLAQNISCGSVTEKLIPLFFNGVDNLNTEGGVRAFPNPTDGKLYLDFKDALNVDFQLVISNTNGQILKNMRLTREAIQEIDLQDFPKGVYFLQFIKNGDSFVKKVVRL